MLEEVEMRPRWPVVAMDRSGRKNSSGTKVLETNVLYIKVQQEGGSWVGVGSSMVKL